ncbi:hypothetical protein ACT89R_01750 [Rhodococcus qingshengii]
MIDREILAAVPQAMHSAARAAVIAAVVMNCRIVVVCRDFHYVKPELDAAIKFAEEKFDGLIERIRRANGEQCLTFYGGGEVRFASLGALNNLGGCSPDMILEAEG